MLPRRRAAASEGRSALSAWAADPTRITRGTVATAVRYTLQVLVERAPGGSTEVRVPPFGVVQCLDGPRHTRGTPPNVVETGPETWLRLACGFTSWAEEVEAGQVRASGVRADLSGLLPLVTDLGLSEGGPRPEG